MAIVARNSQTIRQVPRLSSIVCPAASGLSFGNTRDIIAAGIRKLTADGTNSVKNSVNPKTPFCQTIKVVMSPNGLKAPPAFAATTILMQAGPINRGLLPPTAITTAHIKSAVVKLSAIGEIKNARMPVNQNSDRRPRPEAINFSRNHSKSRRSSMALM